MSQPATRTPQTPTQVGITTPHGPASDTATAARVVADVIELALNQRPTIVGIESSDPAFGIWLVDLPTSMSDIGGQWDAATGTLNIDLP